MKVRALQKGYHGVLREPGDVFEVEDGAKSKWFEELTAADEEDADAAELDAGRAEYQELTGKAAGGRWSLKSVKAKLAQLKGGK
jgi:hypothetical protein